MISPGTRITDDIIGVLVVFCYTIYLGLYGFLSHVLRALESSTTPHLTKKNSWVQCYVQACNYLFLFLLVFLRWNFKQPLYITYDQLVTNRHCHDCDRKKKVDRLKTGSYVNWDGVISAIRDIVRSGSVDT